MPVTYLSIRSATSRRASVGPPHTQPAALLKHDLSAGAVQAHDFRRDAASGEAVFVPAAPDAAEDDGYLLAFVHVPARIPLGFHGNWVPDP
jgi:carotenoid cleavage dioxygenase